MKLKRELGLISIDTLIRLFLNTNNILNSIITITNVQSARTYDKLVHATKDVKLPAENQIQSRYMQMHRHIKLASW